MIGCEGMRRVLLQQAVALLSGASWFAVVLQSVQ